jgi:hypothetical protein
MAFEEAIRGRADRAHLLVRSAWKPHWGNCDKLLAKFDTAIGDSEHAPALLMLQTPP